MYSRITNNFIVGTTEKSTNLCLRLTNSDRPYSIEAEGQYFTDRESDNIETVSLRRLNFLFKKFPKEESFRAEINRRAREGILFSLRYQRVSGRVSG
jgi:hypothetical protein